MNKQTEQGRKFFPTLGFHVMVQSIKIIKEIPKKQPTCFNIYQSNSENLSL